MCALAGVVVVGVLGMARIDINGKVLAILLVSEIVIAVIYDLVMVSHPAGGTVSYATLALPHLWGPGIEAALVTAFTGYVGFEATVVFSEETKDPQRTIARATYISVVITVLYGASAWAMSVATTGELPSLRRDLVAAAPAGPSVPVDPTNGRLAFALSTREEQEMRRLPLSPTIMLAITVVPAAG